VAYSRIEPFIEASVRALFGEFAPTGTPPVSVTGVNYNLQTQTSPDPEQAIALHIGEPPAEGEPTPQPPQLKVGDELRLRTGVIVDHNNHPVPDGTPVQFYFTYPQEGLEHSILAITRNGVAEATAKLDRMGQLDISIQADPIPRTSALQITVQEGEGTPMPTLSPTPTPTPTSTPEPEPTPAETPAPTPGPDAEEETSPQDRAGGLDLLLALMGVAIVGGVGYYTVRSNNGPVRRALQFALWCVVGGLALYIAYALGLPGAAWLRERSGAWAAGWVALLGSVVSLVVAWIVGRRRQPE
jgi:beta-N-acetylhexosaminidase